ncbi:MAG: DUF1186 domain-containing protein [Ardenticatenaceae bacterium]
MNESRIAEILEAFEVYDGSYRRAHVSAALARQEEITPHLIAVLEGVLAKPSVYVGKEDYFAHLYAFILLGHFREQAAHRVIVDLFSLPPNIPDQLFAELVSESLPIVLFRTCHGELGLIKSLALNRQADEYSRGSALRAMTFAVADGMIAREEVLAFFGSLFTGEEAASNSTFWDQLAYCVYDLYPEELMDVIEQAYEDGLIAPGFISYKEFLQSLEGGKERALRRMQAKMQRNSLDNVHKYMSWWACFKENKQVRASVPQMSEVVPSIASSRKKARKKDAAPKSRHQAKRKKKGKKAGSKKKKRR